MEWWKKETRVPSRGQTGMPCEIKILVPVSLDIPIMKLQALSSLQINCMP